MVTSPSLERRISMPTIRSIRWALALGPLLLILAGCENNEAGVTKGTTTSPDALKSTEDSLKQGKEAQKKTTPSSYPGAARR
jgi:hypothetical protein